MQLTVTTSNPAPPANPSLANLVGVCVDEQGSPEAGVTISVRMVVQPPSGAGIAYDGVKNSDVSDANGSIQLVVVRGATYRAMRGIGTKDRQKFWSEAFVIDNADTVSFPSFIGID